MEYEEIFDPDYMTTDDLLADTIDYLICECSSAG